MDVYERSLGLPRDDERYMISKPFILQRTFAREKALHYFCMWDDSDRMGWKDFLDHDISHNLFIVPQRGEKGSVWYTEQEYIDINYKLEKRLQTDETFVQQLTERLDAHWDYLESFALDRSVIDSAEVFSEFYNRLVTWWSAMSTAFTIPDLENIDSNVRELFLQYRAMSEKYTEKMHDIVNEFWCTTYPEHAALAFYLTPTEISTFDSLSQESIQALYARIDGCFMLDEEVHVLSKLDTQLAQHNITLYEPSADEINVITGTVAFKGNVQGTVRYIHTFDDMKDFKPGEILVTEMTNPRYVPIMKQASAIITDEGGTTCHAAIASRELKVPCIVGTKIATQVLKNGDIVEVDADNGTVTILKV